MTAKRKKFDGKNFFIFILLCVVAAQGYVLYRGKPLDLSFIKKYHKPAAVRPPVTTPPKEKAERPEKPILGRIAIIIDDWGYNVQHCDLLADIKYPVTVSILPDLPHSVDVAKCAHAQGKEVMLHLPLEPHKLAEKYPKDYLIKTSMSNNQIREITNESIDHIPFVAGVNNHMGSKATEDRGVMAIIFGELFKRDLFFVDSLVTSESICRNLAREMHIPFTERNIFLDNENTRAAIEAQFAKLAEEAKRRGYAVAIGHDRTLSLQIIKEQTEELAKQGFQFVEADALAK